jgi:hypothetical protein
MKDVVSCDEPQTGFDPKISEWGNPSRAILEIAI